MGSLGDIYLLISLSYLHFIRYLIDVKIIRGEGNDADLRVTKDSETFYLPNPELDFLRGLQYRPRGLNITPEAVVDQGSPGGRYDPAGPGAGQGRGDEDPARPLCGDEVLVVDELVVRVQYDTAALGHSITVSSVETISFTLGA